MKIVHQGKTEEDTIIEFEDAFEALFDQNEAEQRRSVALAERQRMSDPA